MPMFLRSPRPCAPGSQLSSWPCISGHQCRSPCQAFTGDPWGHDCFVYGRLRAACTRVQYGLIIASQTEPNFLATASVFNARRRTLQFAVASLSVSWPLSLCESSILRVLAFGISLVRPVMRRRTARRGTIKKLSRSAHSAGPEVCVRGGGWLANNQVRYHVLAPVSGRAWFWLFVPSLSGAFIFGCVFRSVRGRFLGRVMAGVFRLGRDNGRQVLILLVVLHFIHVCKSRAFL